MRKLKNILVTGGAGFIGCNFIHYLLGMSTSGLDCYKNIDFSGNIINVDKLTYAANLNNLKDVEKKFGSTRYFFEKADICDSKTMKRIFTQYHIDTVIHFAAESHVDRSIKNPENFIKTNIEGTYTLLETAKEYWNCSLEKNNDDFLFHYVSTDEVYGSLDNKGFFTETSLYNPRSPYSASKASAEHLVMSYFYTFGLPVTISNCSNNYGPFQYPEKLIPLMVSKLQLNKPLPVYGTGKNIRDWIYVEDHNKALWQIVNKSKTGEKWNIGASNELENIELLKKIILIYSETKGKNPAELEKLITYVKDRPGHDYRYALDAGKIKKELNWKPEMDFNQGLKFTVEWELEKEKKYNQ